jgi:hypothetical protein
MAEKRQIGWGPKPGEDFLTYITSPEWRRKMAVVLSFGKLTLHGECKLVVRSGGREFLSRTFFNNPEAAAAKYVRKDKPVPARIVRAMLEKRKPGRHTRREEWALQKAGDLACFFAVQHLLDKGKKPTPAGEQVGKLMGLSRQSVIDAWSRIRPKK